MANHIIKLGFHMEHNHRQHFIMVISSQAGYPWRLPLLGMEVKVGHADGKQRVVVPPKDNGNGQNEDLRYIVFLFIFKCKLLVKCICFPMFS